MFRHKIHKIMGAQKTHPKRLHLPKSHPADACPVSANRQLLSSLDTRFRDRVTAIGGCKRGIKEGLRRLNGSLRIMTHFSVGTVLQREHYLFWRI